MELKTKTLTLTLQEVQQLEALLDLAVKTGGLGAAAAALNILSKLEEKTNG